MGQLVAVLLGRLRCNSNGGTMNRASCLNIYGKALILTCIAITDAYAGREGGIIEHAGDREPRVRTPTPAPAQVAAPAPTREVYKDHMDWAAGNTAAGGSVDCPAV